MSPNSETQKKELSAFFAFFATFNLIRPVTSVADLCDGAPLFEVLTLVDADYFRQTTRPSVQPPDNWVLRFSALKRLYRLMTQYFADVLQKPTSGLDVPDLQAMAKDNNVSAALTMCRLTIAIAVQCEKNKETIEKIQGLTDTNQYYLKMAIEVVMAKITPGQSSRSLLEASVTEDDHYYEIQTERSRVLTEKETLENVYQNLLEDHRILLAKYDDTISEKDDALAKLREMSREADFRRNDKTDAALKAEISRLRLDLQKSEENLAVAEAELDKQTVLITELTRKVDELQIKADEAAKLKDQVDEYRHAAEKLQKTENVMDKYKKKLQEGADLRQHVKSLERQIAELVDRNANLEDDYRKVSAFKPLMDSYKSQITELESKSSARSQENEALRFDLEQTRIKLKIALDERAKDSEAIELYQERVRELELSKPASQTKARHPGKGARTEGEYLDEDNVEQGLGDELDGAISGATMIDLRLQNRKLKRELESLRSSTTDSSRVMVLENMLEDAKRMKARYEADYLASHREKLVLQRDLDEIRSGKFAGDSTAAAIALRQRLNESVDELDKLRKERTELHVKLESQERELTIAKSNLNLVNKDQLDILATLRESVNEDKAALEVEAERLKTQNQEMVEKNRMQLEQVNALLLEKVNLQGESIGQKQLMIERERDFSDLRASLNANDLPEDVKSRLLDFHEQIVSLKEQVKAANEKLLKAKAFIKSQDKLLKEEQAAKLAGVSSSNFEEAEASFRSQIKILEDELARQKRVSLENLKRYRREQELMLSVLHTYGMKEARDHLGAPVQQPRPGPTSWLALQRKTLGQTLRR